METLIDELPEAAAESRTGAIEVEVGSAPVAPNFTDEQAQQLADQANQMTANGLQLTAGEATETVPAEQLRAWIGPTADGGKLELAINADAVNQGAARRLRRHRRQTRERQDRARCQRTHGRPIPSRASPVALTTAPAGCGTP